MTMEKEIHEQVRKQLQYLKCLVDGEVEMEQRCKEWGIRYTPSRRKWEDIDNYERYKREVETNGDKNLLAMVDMRNEHDINMYGIYPFARRYVHEEYLVHRTGHGTEIMLRESNAKLREEISKLI
jgi:hypothetical protein